MLIKEYRIPLPLTVEEYRIAQLYMIAKKSRDESSGEGSGIEILVNEPYDDGPGGAGQYTHKIYHVGSHLPGWLKSLMPKSALTVEEKAWNAYPYTRTIYTCPFVEKFSLDIETVYKGDPGDIENVFNLNKAELRDRIVDLIDVVRDQLTGADYLKEEDPSLFVSRKTQRGPLADTWIQDYWRECKGNTLPLPNGKAMMCAYKLCRVEFKYWGMQAKIERFIHDIALRKTMVRAHRQAWAWQDEWFNMTMEDIREMERQTQMVLAQKMGSATSNNASFDDQSAEPAADAGDKTPALAAKSGASGESASGGLPTSASRSSTTGCSTSWPISCISESSSEDDEFFDCQEETRPGRMASGMVRWSSMELVAPGEEGDDLEREPDKSGPYSLESERIPERDSIFSQGYLQKCASANRRTSRSAANTFYRASPLSVRASSPSTAAGNRSSSHPANGLILVFHGGTVVDPLSPDLAAKNADLATFRSSLEAVSRQHFPNLTSGKLAMRLVPCPSLCSDAITVLNSISPADCADAVDSNAATAPSAAGADVGGGGGGVTNSWPPLGCLPLFAASSPEFYDGVARLIQAANQTHAEFVKSAEGAGFAGSVTLVGDAVGSVLLYDALCRGQDSPSRFGSENSIAEDVEDLHERGLRPHLQTPVSRKISSTSSEANSSRAKNYFDFEVGDVFLLGSPLSLVLAFRRWSQSHAEDRASAWPRPHCQGIYNLFHPMDPSAARLEPLLSARFANTRPVSVPRYQRYPLGDGKSSSLADFIQNHPQLFQDVPQASVATANGVLISRRTSDASTLHGSSTSIGSEQLAAQMTSLSQRWWGSKRLDYSLYCPEGITSFPSSALPHLLHSSFWESADVAAFILRHLMGMDGGGAAHYGDDGIASAGDKFDANRAVAQLPFSPSQPCEKWLRKRTSVKIKNIGANHRANDVIVNEVMPQVIVARFMYGPLDMVALTGERVDIHFLRDATNGEWDLLTSEVTDKTGRLVCTLPPDRTLGPGLHPIKMVVRGDHTYADLYVAVLPQRTQAVVFSIDGSFTASVSVTGRDPKVRAGALDVVRHWQELGYLIIYITGRPDMQQRRVVSWLAQHNFPHGLLSFADGLSTDPLRHKAEYLKFLVNDVGLEIRAAYGSCKDISVYASVGLKPDSIFIVGKIGRKQTGMAQSLIEGYASHLAALAVMQCRPAHINPYLLLPRGCLSLPGHGAPLLRRRHWRD